MHAIDGLLNAVQPHGFAHDGSDVRQVALPVFRLPEEVFRQRAGVPRRPISREEGVEVVDIVGAPVAPAHDGADKRVVQIPRYHLKPPFLIEVEVVIVHVVAVVGVEVADDGIGRHRPQNAVDVEHFVELIGVELQGFNQVEQFGPAVVRFDGVAVEIEGGVGTQVAQIRNAPFCAVSVFIAKHPRPVALEQDSIVFIEVFVQELAVDALRIHIQAGVVPLGMELDEVDFRSWQVLAVDAAGSVFLAVGRIEPGVGQFDLVVAEQILT